MFDKPTQFVCKECGHVGGAGRASRGSIWIEVVLWLLILLPGIAYSIWRMTTKYNVCSICKSKNIIPVDSPLGKKLARQVR